MDDLRGWVKGTDSIAVLLPSRVLLFSKSLTFFHLRETLQVGD